MADSIGMMFIARSMKRRVIVYHIPSFFQDGPRIVDTFLCEVVHVTLAGMESTEFNEYICLLAACAQIQPAQCCIASAQN